MIKFKHIKHAIMLLIAALYIALPMFLTLCMLGNFPCFLLSSADFFQNHFLIFQDTIKAVKPLLYNQVISEGGSLLDLQEIVKHKQRRRHDRLSSETTIYLSPCGFVFPQVLDLCRVALIFIQNKQASYVLRSHRFMIAISVVSMPPSCHTALINSTDFDKTLIQHWFSIGLRLCVHCVYTLSQ